MYTIATAAAAVGRNKTAILRVMDEQRLIARAPNLRSYEPPEQPIGGGSSGSPSSTTNQVKIGNPVSW